jgi:hypothetical protein
MDVNSPVWSIVLMIVLVEVLALWSIYYILRMAYEEDRDD